MNDKQQTAVEWLVEKLKSQGLLIGEPNNLVAFREAKSMEEQQNEDMYKKGWFDAIETYGVNKCQFEIDNSNTSATICKWCGKEKWQHKTYGGNK